MSLKYGTNTMQFVLRPRARPPPPRPAAAAWAAPPCPQAPPAPAGRHAALPRRRPALWPAGAPPVGQIRTQAEGSQGGGVAGGRRRSAAGEEEEWRSGGGRPGAITSFSPNLTVNLTADSRNGIEGIGVKFQWQ